MSLGFDLIRPCPKCPFRSDIPGYLKPGRVRALARELPNGTFTCHETTVPDVDNDDELVDGPNAQHCAGALILLEKLEQPSQMMRICERLGMYDMRKLDMAAPVYETFGDMEDAMRRGREG